MKRYLDDKYMTPFLRDFKFLFEIIRKQGGEIDLRLRDNYFNLYYQGNSIAKVEFKSVDSTCVCKYEISIHKEFVCGVFAGDVRFPGRENSNGYINYDINSDLVHAFFQSKHLKRLCSNVVKRGNGEEITFEQLLITENNDRDDLLIIDRQVTEPGMSKKIDLLALKREHQNDNKFCFVVYEVKLGKNPELSGKVAGQISGYLDHIEKNHSSWKRSYEDTFSQMKLAGFFPHIASDTIEIAGGVDGVVVVGGYRGLAIKSIKTLKDNFPSIKVKHIENTL